MIKTTAAILAIALAVMAPALGQLKNFTPVTPKMLENPSPNDWLMFSRTYDAQRFSPLDQINKQNVGQLRLAWERGMGAGQTETIPIVYNGVMYVVNPGAVVQALDATNGDLIWEYKREAPANVANQGRTKSLAIYQDVILYTAPDSYVVGLDARSGAVRWETKADTRGHTSGPIVVDGFVISGGACAGNRANCYIAAHDALTGKEVWRFYTTPATGEPGDETWAGAAVANRQASTWGLPGKSRRVFLLREPRKSSRATCKHTTVFVRCFTTSSRSKVPTRRKNSWPMSGGMSASNCAPSAMCANSRTSFAKSSTAIRT